MSRIRDPVEASMRLPVLLAVTTITTTAAFGQAPIARAQSAGAYPFCAVYANKGGTPMCYFATREQCNADISGVGGLCIENASYRASAAAASPRHQHGAAHRHR
jgi:hypothetical protein